MDARRVSLAEGISLVGQGYFQLRSTQTTGIYSVSITPVSDYFDMFRVSQWKPVTALNAAFLGQLPNPNPSEDLTSIMVNAAAAALNKHELREVAKGLIGIVNRVYNPKRELQSPSLSFEPGDVCLRAHFMAHYQDGPAAVARIKVGDPENLREEVLKRVVKLEKIGFVLENS